MQIFGAILRIFRLQPTIMAIDDATLDKILDRIDDQLPQALERLKAFLRIRSISTDPAFSDDCSSAADWLVNDLNEIGFDARRHNTPGHPMVVAKSPQQNDSGRSLLFYGHYDVQPVDPLELWKRDPFDPVIEKHKGFDALFARGAADDKGQLMTFVEACRCWKDIHGELPPNITLFFEGEEESGSPSLVPFMEDNKDLLKSDLALVCDTGMWNAETPAISTMLRGMVGEEITITGPSRDLHSGMYGGPAINPIRVLTRILGVLHDDNGSVQLPGFYEGVTELPEKLARQWESLEFSQSDFLSDVGLSVPAGEKGYSVLQQIWSRPTCEINGINGGYTGEGFKTVLPSQAVAKLSFRLVGEQDPDKISSALYQWVEERLPEDCTVSFKSKDGSPATVMPIDDPVFTQAADALETEWQKPAVFAGCGGSIPVVGYFREILGTDSLLVGFGLDDDAIHSPNEKYNLSSYHKGTRSWARILQVISAA